MLCRNSKPNSVRMDSSLEKYLELIWAAPAKQVVKRVAAFCFMVGYLNGTRLVTISRFSKIPQVTLKNSACNALNTGIE